jgi:hypothetical protein
MNSEKASRYRRVLWSMTALSMDYALQACPLLHSLTFSNVTKVSFDYLARY